MAIDISAASAQAMHLCEYADRLQQAKNQINDYKASLAANWQGSEVPYMSQSLDKAIMQIDAVMRDLRNIAKDVNNTAAAIKREDDAAAAAARARAAKQQQIASAQKAYNTACDELAELNKERDALVAKLRDRPSLIFRYRDDIEKLSKKIAEAEKKCEECKNALAAARG